MYKDYTVKVNTVKSKKKRTRIRNVLLKVKMISVMQ